MKDRGSQPAEWTLILRPRSGWFDFNPAELWRHRDLILLFVKRDFVSVYKQTILGPLWYLLQPLFTTLVFTVIFSRIANIPTDGLPPMLFYMAGTVAWTYFAECLNKTSNTFTANAAIFGKVYFPRLAVPLSIVISNLFTLLIQTVFFLCFYLYFFARGADIAPNRTLLFLPLLILQMAMLGFGMGVIISSITTKYRDLRFAVGFLVQLWMYATPVVYPLSQVPEKWKGVFLLNPMTSIIEAFRYSFLGAGSADFAHISLSFLLTFAILAAGIVLFSKVEKNFMDTV